LQLPLLESALPSNQRQLERAVAAVLALPAERIGVIGLAFKENTDDLRESPVIALLEQLIGKGHSVRVFDPHIRMDNIYGANRNFILNAIPHIGRLLDNTLDDLLSWSDYLVVTQKPSAEIAAQLAASCLPILDLVGTSTSSPVSSLVR